MSWTVPGELQHHGTIFGTYTPVSQNVSFPTNCQGNLQIDDGWGDFREGGQ